MGRTEPQTARTNVLTCVDFSFDGFKLRDPKRSFLLLTATVARVSVSVVFNAPVPSGFRITTSVFPGAN